jgi:hypothetical protein
MGFAGAGEFSLIQAVRIAVDINCDTYLMLIEEQLGEVCGLKRWADDGCNF